MSSEAYPSEEQSDTVKQFIELYAEFNCRIAAADESFLAARFHELLGNRDRAEKLRQDWYAKVTDERLLALQGAQRKVMDVLSTRFPATPLRSYGLSGQDWKVKTSEEIEGLVATETANTQELFVKIRRDLSIAYDECVLAIDEKRCSDAFSWLCAFQHVKAIQSEVSATRRLQSSSPVAPDPPPRAA